MDDPEVTIAESRPTAVDLFSGCGGVSQGLVDAGYQVVLAVEIDAGCCEVYEQNHPHTVILNADLRATDLAAALSAAGVHPGKLDLLAGCPPCQAFSRLNTKNGFRFKADDERNDLVSLFFQVARQLRPKNLILENVPALAGDKRLEDGIRLLRTLDYDVTHKIQDAADFGVPQRRKRLVMVGSRVGPARFPRRQESVATVRDAIANLEDPGESDDSCHNHGEARSEKVREIIGLIPHDGGSRKSLPDRLILDCHRKTSGFSDVYGRLAWDRPSATITGGCHSPSKGRYLHPAEDRTITMREAALLQGFPRHYRFAMGRGKLRVAQMIGNAIPPPLMKAHAEAILRNDQESER